MHVDVELTLHITLPVAYWSGCREHFMYNFHKGIRPKITDTVSAPAYSRSHTFFS